MKHADLRHENCAIARSPVVVLKRYVWAIGRRAFNGVRRFEDFQRRIGLAGNILNDRLDGLVDLGIVERRRYAQHAFRALDGTASAVVSHARTAARTSAPVTTEPGGRVRPASGRVAPMTRREHRNVPPVLAVSRQSGGS
ncbi:winged helix-turn-helix transcriptional regulator [Rhodococcus koreensis]|uniref:winged helix-turn-helix transcriptional regulator n=1 Tax=Rhodococcus koreensis TaxID=99653 RepID=UPI003672F23A